MLRRIFSILAIAFLAVTTFVSLPATARAEGWFQQQSAEQSNPTFQDRYDREDGYSPNNDQFLQDNQYAQNNGQNSQNNDQNRQEQRESSFFNNNQSNQDKGQNQQQSSSDTARS
ncbi:hypothetical protein V0288_06175 [Pannus brasiliensis CCIBt3594]|uniref:Secreted protein n=1 Tax=Pannus brasiliensis CCIBt3594 TaxID=1427578 RepID=A0AAW9QRZ0_9CHRO